MTPSRTGPNILKRTPAGIQGVPLFVPLGLMAVSLAALLIFVFEFEAVTAYIERPYLIPWVLATGAVVTAPVIYISRRGQLSFLNPIVFHTLVYFFPVFFVGGWSLVFGWSNYHYLNYVSDPEWNFPLAFVYVMLGLGGLSFGFLLPVGKKIGNAIGSKLPNWEFSTNELIFLGVGFVPIGIFLLVAALGSGTAGYQAATEGPSIREIGSLGVFLSIILPTSLMFLWIALFRMNEWNVSRFAVLGFIVVISLFVAATWGSKGALFGALQMFLFAMAYVRKSFSGRQWALIAIGALLVLFIGVTYGNTFRAQKGTFGTVTIDQYYQHSIDALYVMWENDLDTQVASAVSSVLERVEITSSLAVVVSNHELLAPYEKAYGLENNIWNYTWTSFIPRLIWKDKPTIADSNAFNELYFDATWSGFSITAFGDLLRNFGTLGVPLGMFVLGLFLRIFYATLVEGVVASSWKIVLFCLVLPRVNYEAFYGQILPDTMRVAAVVIFQILVMRLLVVLYRGSRP